MDSRDILIAEHHVHVFWTACLGRRLFLVPLLVSWQSERAQCLRVTQVLSFLFPPPQELGHHFGTNIHGVLACQLCPSRGGTDSPELEMTTPCDQK